MTPESASAGVATVVRAFFANWQIECCQDPPGVGDVVSWGLRWHAGGLEPGAASLPWRPSPWTPTEEGFGAGVVLRWGGVTAWSEAETEADVPDPGWLSVEVHGGVPEDVPRTSGRVRRVQVVEQGHEQAFSGSRVWVPGAFTLSEVRRSPKRFRWGPLPGARVPAAQESGVLVDLEVPASGSGSPTGTTLRRGGLDRA